MVKITESKPAAPVTQKSLRGGGNKWTLSHLPANTQSLFTDYLTPLVKLKVGASITDPWAPLSRTCVQAVVDEVYGDGVHQVKDNDVWCALVCTFSSGSILRMT